jgi:hypothetical protein
MFSGESLTTGIYFFQFKPDEGMVTKKVVIE